MEKKIYVSPDAEIISFASEDIMTNSLTGDGTADDKDVWPEWDDPDKGWD